MTTKESLKSGILTYFGTISSPAHGSLTIRDFNAQLMSNMFQAGDRDVLAAALEELVAEGLLQVKTAGAYSLTPKGVAAAADAKANKARDIASKPR
jgi:hypothetical protein